MRIKPGEYQLYCAGYALLQHKGKDLAALKATATRHSLITGKKYEIRNSLGVVWRTEDGKSEN